MVYNGFGFVYNDFGCYDSTTQVINVLDALIFNVPNSFTPNGDEFNNVFKPVFGSGFSPEDYSLLVYNRWGETVFQSLDLFNGWDGTYNGTESPSATYYYVIVKGDAEEGVTGTVNIIR